MTYKPKECATCAKIYTPGRSSSKYCSSVCSRAAKAARQRRQRAERSASLRRTCTICGLEFTAKVHNARYCSKECKAFTARERASLWYKENTSRAKETRRKYSASHKKQRRQYLRDLPESTKEKRRERQRQWYAKNRATILAKSRAHYQANKDAYIERNRRWRANNPDKAGISEARRAKAELEGNATPGSIRAKWEAGNHSCILCGQPIDDTLPPNHPMSRTLEHLTPISRGGTHDIDNLDFAHFRCNSSKNNKTLEEYRDWVKQVA